MAASRRGDKDGREKRQQEGRDRANAALAALTAARVKTPLHTGCASRVSMAAEAERIGLLGLLDDRLDGRGEGLK